MVKGPLHSADGRSACWLWFRSGAGHGGAKRDPVSQPWYAKNVADLTSLNREAEDLFEKGNQDAAAVLMKQGEALSHRLLEVPRPTLEATEAAADL